MFDMCLTIRFCVMKSDSNTPLAGTCTSTSYLQPLSKSSACFGSSPRSWATAGKHCPPPSKVSSIPSNFSACRNRILADERPGAVRTKEPRLALAFMPFWLAALIACVGSVASAQALSDDGALKTFAVHINRTPPQSWPGYGVYLGNGFVLTAAHVPGNFAETKPHVLIAGQDLPASLIKEGSLGTIDLTLMAIDATNLPIRLRMSRMPLCERAPFPGETVVVAIPEGTARSRILPPAAIPADLRGRFDTVIGDVATTGNSGSGVFDAWKQCLLGIISRKITVASRRMALGAPPQTRDIAKYFVPVRDIRLFMPTAVSF